MEKNREKNTNFDENFDQNEEISSKNELTVTQTQELTTAPYDSFSKYLKEIQQFPILSREEEYEYAKKFQENGDKEAAKMLIQCHLRLVVKIAGKFRNYGLPITDLVSEGNLGLIRAVKKFDPDKGFRFSTYAMWWVKAAIQEYILRSWSLVKIGTTSAQKKLFFNLNKVKRRLLGNGQENLSDENLTEISDNLNVEEKDVKEMDLRLQGGDLSLNEGEEIGEIVIDDGLDIEKQAIDKQERQKHEALLREAFAVLNEREKDILISRQMSEISATLEEVAKKYKISSERVRQLEQNALKKLKKEIFRLQKQAL